MWHAKQKLVHTKQEISHTRQEMWYTRQEMWHTRQGTVTHQTEDVTHQTGRCDTPDREMWHTIQGDGTHQTGVCNSSDEGVPQARLWSLAKLIHCVCTCKLSKLYLKCVTLTFQHFMFPSISFLPTFPSSKEKEKFWLVSCCWIIFG